MSRRIEWTPAVLRDARKLDPQIAARVARALERFAALGQGDVVQLQRTARKEWRLRVGDWRVRFALPIDEVILVLHVLPRGRAYRD